MLKGAKSERTVAAADFFLDTFMTALEPGEIVREVIVPVEDAGTGTHYEKVVQKASGFAVVGVAVRLKKSGGKIEWARVGVTGLSNHAYRATAVEKALEENGDVSMPRRWWRTGWTQTPICTRRPNIGSIWPWFTRPER